MFWSYKTSTHDIDLNELVLRAYQYIGRGPAMVNREVFFCWFDNGYVYCIIENDKELNAIQATLLIW